MIPSTIRHVSGVVLLAAFVGCAGTNGDVEKWTQLLKTGSPEQHRAAVDSLAAIGPPARAALPALFSTPLPPDGNMMDFASRAVAVEKILSPSDQKSMDAVAFALREGSGIKLTIGTTELDLGRVLASNALGKKGLPAVPILRDALTSSDPEVRRAAAVALGDIGPPAAALPDLQTLASDTSNRRLHEAVTKAIGAIRPGS